MTQMELNQAIVRQTGESLATIKAVGFSLQDELLDELFDASCSHFDGYCLDCPGCGHPVLLTDGPLDSLPEFAECTGCDVAYPFQLKEVYDGQLAESA